MDYNRRKRYKPLNMLAQDLDRGDLLTYNSTTTLIKSCTTGGGKKTISYVTQCRYNVLYF